MPNGRFRIKQQNGGRQLGLTINAEKIKAMGINAKNQESIMIAGLRIGEGNEFSYLEATVCKEGGDVDDLENRLSKSGGTFVGIKRI